MPHQPYPTFDVDCAKDIYRIVTSGQIVEEKSLFAKCVYTLVGAGLGLTLGEPDDVKPLLLAAEGIDLATLEQCREALAGVADTGLPPGMMAAPDAGEKAIDPATLAMLIQLAVQLITAFINRKKK